MQDKPLRTTVVGSYPFPAWLEFASGALDHFGAADLEELRRDAVVVAVQDQMDAGLDVITDGEQARFDFNLSFYGRLQGVQLESQPLRRFGPPAHDQRGKHRIVGELTTSQGLGTAAEFRRLLEVNTGAASLKASVPGPYTMSGRLLPNEVYPDRFSIAEALLPIIQHELISLVNAGCTELAVDEPSMSCYAYREDCARLVDLFNRTVAPVVGQCRLSTHLCFGNYKGHPVSRRSYAAMIPAFLDFEVDEIHVEMANREFSEVELLGEIARRKDVAVGVVDVKNYYIEPPEIIAARVRRCLEHVAPDQLSLAPDCGLSQTARWAARQKLENLVLGVATVRKELHT